MYTAWRRSAPLSRPRAEGRASGRARAVSGRLRPWTVLGRGCVGRVRPITAKVLSLDGLTFSTGKQPFDKLHNGFPDGFFEHCFYRFQVPVYERRPGRLARAPSHSHLSLANGEGDRYSSGIHIVACCHLHLLSSHSAVRPTVLPASIFHSPDSSMVARFAGNTSRSRPITDKVSTLGAGRQHKTGSAATQPGQSISTAVWALNLQPLDYSR